MKKIIVVLVAVVLLSSVALAQSMPPLETPQAEKWARFIAKSLEGQGYIVSLYYQGDSGYYVISAKFPYIEGNENLVICVTSINSVPLQIK